MFAVSAERLQLGQISFLLPTLTWVLPGQYKGLVFFFFFNIKGNVVDFKWPLTLGPPPAPI